MKKILSIFGTRPEAIKMAPVIKELEKRSNIKSIVCITAQHRDMLDQVLEAFDIIPDYDLDIMRPDQTLSHITSTALLGIEDILIEEHPDIVLVHGDTTTAMAAALAAAYQHIPIGHVEAGLRTHNIQSPFPEEINRQIIDHIADYLFAPTEVSAEHLKKDLNQNQKIFITGNTAIDALKTTVDKNYHHEALDWVGSDRLILVTAHRRENLGEPMRQMFTAMRNLVEKHKDIKIIYPVHLNPHVQAIAKEVLGNNDRIRLIAPLDVLDFHNFMERAFFIMSDSGGVQEEAPSLGKPVLVLRDTTERPEGIVAGTLKLVGTKAKDVYAAAEDLLTDAELYGKMSEAKNPYGDGFASRRIVDILVEEKLHNSNITKPSNSSKSLESISAELEAIKKLNQTIQNEKSAIEKENKALKRLISSKRFRAATRVAESYNHLFPLGTNRRRIIASATRKALASRAKARAKREAKRLGELSNLAKGYERVLVINSIPYEIKLKQRPQHLADEFAKLGYFVVYLEPNVPGLNIRKVTKNLVTISDYKYLRGLSQKIKYFLLPNTMAIELTHLKEICSWGYELIYDYIDEFHEDISGDLSLQLNVFNHLEELKPCLAIVTATRLEEHLKKDIVNLCPIIMAANAVNVDHFNYQKQNNAVPVDLAEVINTNHKVIGFYGALAPWIDFKLINHVAANHPDWEIVLIGMNYNGALAGLKPAKNIHHYDSKQYSELINYAKHFNCAIIPFHLGEIAQSTSPVKLFEYMATGIPIVGTRDLLECRGYDYVYLAENYDDFESKLKQAITDHEDPAARLRLLEQAEENTWAKRAATIDTKLHELEQ